MWQQTDHGASQSSAVAGREARESTNKQKFDILDLYEELLLKRAEMGFRPVIFVSSERDLECSLIGMFELEDASNRSGEDIPAQTSLEELRHRLS